MKLLAPDGIIALHDTGLHHTSNRNATHFAGIPLVELPDGKRGFMHQPVRERNRTGPDACFFMESLRSPQPAWDPVRPRVRWSASSCSGW